MDFATEEGSYCLSGLVFRGAEIVVGFIKRDQEFTKEVVGSVCLCCIKSGASAGRLKCLGMS